MTLAKVYAQGRCPAYKISKAALNMLTVQYAQQYADEGFTFLAVSPGVSISNSCRPLKNAC
jgi:NAD(P)-dependent dehydrogenase (short-subunit alcohol dehydrogenase family)